MTERYGEPEYRSSQGVNHPDTGAESAPGTGVRGDSDPLKASRQANPPREVHDTSGSDYSRSN
ncbi:MAG: hypothetical protein HGA54_05990 [Actinobacteria bacterium]|nr:hypothetical protein [Actinomycetota bacterium]